MPSCTLLVAPLFPLLRTLLGPLLRPMLWPLLRPMLGTPLLGTLLEHGKTAVF